MVRFGNVLDSSGSVIPRFHNQIEKGGPVTVTHPDINRFFMTIPEASQLILQAGAMACGGEVFVLDMGDPIKIVDLARTMIEKAGLTVRDHDKIIYSGLRAGEKLYEELLIGENPTKTGHPKIFKANEPYVVIEELEQTLSVLSEQIMKQDDAGIISTLEKTVQGYRQSTPKKHIP
jgi:FlaA1/EpsC-like NDP-sugar epimerase